MNCWSIVVTNRIELVDPPGQLEDCSVPDFAALRGLAKQQLNVAAFSQEPGEDFFGLRDVFRDEGEVRRACHLGFLESRGQLHGLLRGGPLNASAAAEDGSHTKAIE